MAFLGWIQYQLQATSKKNQRKMGLEKWYDVFGLVENNTISKAESREIREKAVDLMKKLRERLLRKEERHNPDA